MMTSYLLTALAGLSLAAPAPKDDAIKMDLDKLQGTWIVVSMEGNGELVKDPKDTKFVFAGNRVTFHYRGEKQEATPFAINPAKSPREIDFTQPDAMKDDPAWPGIYLVEGDSLKIYLPDYHTETKAGGKTKIVFDRKVVVGERPTSFVEKQAKSATLLVLKRDKK